MLPKTRRYIEQPTKTKPKYYHTKDLMVVFQNSPDFFRLRVVVSKKIDKKAVGRNLFRRRIQHAVKQTLGVKLDPPTQMVVVAKPSIKNCSYHQLLTQISKVIKSAKIDL